MLTLNQRFAVLAAEVHEALYHAARMHNGCIPGVIQSYNASNNTVTVRPAITEPVVINGVRQDLEVLNGTGFPMVKLAVFGAGGFFVTFPVQQGDECILLFQDICLDAAWQNGGVGNPQLDKRRHDLSDAICIPLSWTQPKMLASYSTASMQIRSTDGTTVIDIREGQITISAGTQVQITAPAIAMGPSGGTPIALATVNLYNWVNTTLIPALAAHSITVTAPPTNSITTDVKGS